MDAFCLLLFPFTLAIRSPVHYARKNPNRQAAKPPAPVHYRHEGTKIPDTMRRGYQLLAISYRLSAIGYQLSAISYRLSAIDYRFHLFPRSPVHSFPCSPLTRHASDVPWRRARRWLRHAPPALHLLPASNHSKYKPMMQHFSPRNVVHNIYSLLRSYVR